MTGCYTPATVCVMTIAIALALTVIGPAILCVWDPAGHGVDEPQLVARRIHDAIARRIARKGN